MAARPGMVGRQSELEALTSASESAAAGEPCAVLLHGELGIGKTTLVRALAASARDDGCHVLSGQCLRFGADVTSFLPLIQAVEQWRSTPAGTPSASRSLDAVRRVGRAMDDVFRGGPLRFAALVDDFQRDRPTVLLVDDLQWSDPSSLDVLLYLIASFRAGQRLLVVGTYRDTDLQEGHRLRGWLADALRLPSVSDLGLRRMDLWTIEQLMLQRGGSSADAALAEEVFRRSLGNPYLATLLMDDAAGGGGAGEQVRGRGLTDALAASWHRLSAAGRRVTQLLAVAGGPVPFPVLRDLAIGLGVRAEELAPALAEAAGQGIVSEDDLGGVWFRHPLLAEVIAGTVRPWESTEVHRSYARLWRVATGVRERDRVDRLALHFSAAGDAADALTWSLLAADEAQSGHAWKEQATHLSRAVSLAAQLGGEPSAPETVDLLIRAADACDLAGDDPMAVRHYESALRLIDDSTDPLLASRVLLRLHVLRLAAGLGSRSLEEPLRVLRITDGLPPCEERAAALAHLAYAEVFQGLPLASEHAEAAVHLAGQVESAGTLAAALSTRAQTRWGTEDGVMDAERALGLARGAGDLGVLTRATICLSNSYQSAGRTPEAAAVTEKSFLVLRDAGHFGEAAVVGAEASSWNLVLGRWERARPMIRELLMMAVAPRTSGWTRCNAALLTALEGDESASVLHLRRAEELMTNATPVGDPLLATQIQVWIALGDPRRSLELIEQHMAEILRVDPFFADQWLQWAAQAAADLAEGGTSDGRATAMAALERIEALRGSQPSPFESAGPLDLIHPALKALYEAERARCGRDWAICEELWAHASEATSRADMRYDHALALFHWARATFENRHSRQAAISRLREAQAIAAELGARPLLQRIATLSTQAHVSVEPGPGPASSAPGASEPASIMDPRLTRREVEVLNGLTAGETYAQIAKRLFISEKTVSSHVSHLLTKTDTSSRIELVTRYGHRGAIDR